MENDITPERIANSIMMKNDPHKYYLIVEGTKDLKFYGKFIDEKFVEITIALGWKNVHDTLSILDDRSFLKKLGIIDSDFTKILDIKQTVPGLFTTDDHDIEVTMIKSQALDNLIKFYSGSKKCCEFESTTKKNIRDCIFNLAKEIGYLKLANNIDGLGLIFKPKCIDGKILKYSDFIDEKSLDYKGSSSLISAVENYSRNKSSGIKNSTIIKNSFERAKLKKYDLYQLVNGHDLSNILYIFLKKTLKSSNKMLHNSNAIEDSLIMIYEYDYFRTTELFKALSGFEKSIGCKVLK